MSFRATALWRQYLGLITLGLMALPAMAQSQTGQPPLPITFPRDAAVTSTLVKAPNMGNSGSSGENQWLKVEWHYAVLPYEGQGDFLPEVQFKVWVEGRDMLDKRGKPNEGVAIALTGSVTYINVAKARDGYGVIFIHPSTLARYSNPRAGGLNDFDRKFDIHVEALIDGKSITGANKGRETDPDWYQAPTATKAGLSAVPNLVYRQDQCPFIIYDPDKYPALKLPESASK